MKDSRHRATKYAVEGLSDALAAEIAPASPTKESQSRPHCQITVAALSPSGTTSQEGRSACWQARAM
jgi:NAD(P)-dependent dehydrogenase (short-subunit alcohol dehydrogenase family)